MNEEYTTKHKGWFYGCPIYVYDIESEAPTIEPRRKFLEPLLWLSINVIGASILAVCDFISGEEQEWGILVTDEIEDKRKLTNTETTNE